MAAMWGAVKCTRLLGEPGAVSWLVVLTDGERGEAEGRKKWIDETRGHYPRSAASRVCTAPRSSSGSHAVDSWAGT